MYTVGSAHWLLLLYLEIHFLSFNLHSLDLASKNNLTPPNPQVDYVNNNLTKLVGALPQDQLMGIVSAVLTNPSTQQMFSQILLSTLSNLPLQQIQQQMKQLQPNASALPTNAPVAQRQSQLTSSAHLAKSNSQEEFIKR
jgi:hypothetical protein